MEWTLEIVLVVLLAATLLQAIRLERALGVLKRDRASLEALVAGFNASTHQAENGIERLRAAADGAGRQIESQLAKSITLKDDLSFLSERGDRLADRLESLIRAARPIAPDRPQDRASDRPQDRQQDRTQDRLSAQSDTASQVERDLLQALRLAP